MTERQRERNAAFMREHPLLWGVLMYAVTFLGCAVAADALRLIGAGGLSRAGSYLLPLAVALPMWIGSRGWARRAENRS